LSYDIAILGAGVAGLAAARTLALAGARVALIEARRRVGGRVYTEHTTDDSGTRQIPVELGAEFVHGLPQETWALLREAGLDSYELDGLEITFAGGQLLTQAPQRSGGFAVLEDMASWLRTQPPGTDMSFSDYLARSGVDAGTSARALGYVEGFNAADSRRIGIAALAEQQRAEQLIDSERLFHVRAGYDALPMFLARQFERAGGIVMLGSVVQRIDWQSGAVNVHGTLDSGQPFRVQAARALISVPLGVLQSGALEFSPVPADILTQAARLAMGAARRQTLIFRSRFWLQDLSFLFTPESLPATWWTSMPNDVPMITGWIGGPKVALFDAALERSLSTLAQAFGLGVAEVRALLVSSHSHDWQADPYSRGSYSYAPAGALDASERMTRPVDGTLYFAGEHTDVTGHWGTVHAALRSGLRAAAQMLQTA